MKKFQENKIYKMIWIGDSELETFYKVISRTPKTITIKDLNTDEIKKCRISAKSSEYAGCESVHPMGVYSMCPVLRAEREVA